MVFQITSGNLSFEVEADSQEQARWEAFAVVERDADKTLKYFDLANIIIRYKCG